MISKHIKHHLTQDGKQFFHTHWLPRLKREQLKTAGFKQILIGKKQGDDDTLQLVLQFEDKNGVNNWAANTEHQVLLDLLSPYLKQPSHIDYFEFNLY